MSTKLVLVTGAGRGIGREIALRLAADGFSVSGCARSATELEETRKLSDGKIRISPVDVTSAEDVDAWVKTEADHAGRHNGALWGLVTAAGIHGDIAPFTEVNWAEWKKGVDVNLYGTAHACHSFAKYLVKKKFPGRIVLLSGGGATQPIENLSSYCASKAAVVRFGETLAYELVDHGITVNSVAPGAVNTAITEAFLKAGPAKLGKTLYEKTLKQKESGGTPPGKAAALIAYLMSEQSAPVNGRLISAVWDDWATLHENRDVLDRKDLLTLRRLTQ